MKLYSLVFLFYSLYFLTTPLFFHIIIIIFMTRAATAKFAPTKKKHYCHAKVFNLDSLRVASCRQWKRYFSSPHFNKAQYYKKMRQRVLSRTQFSARGWCARAARQPDYKICWTRFLCQRWMSTCISVEIKRARARHLFMQIVSADVRHHQQYGYF